MQRLVTAPPEPLVSRFRVTADLVASVLSRPDGPSALKHLLRTNHDPEPRRRQHQRRAIAVYRSLEAAGVAERRRDAHGRCLGVRVGSLVEGEDERSALRFSSPLMTFAIEVIATLDRDDPAYVVDVVSVVESVLDDPRQVLFAQQNAAKARRGRPPQGRGRAVRGAHRAARVDHVAAPARRAARRLLRHLPTAPSVDRPQNRRRSRSCARCSRAATRSPRSCAATGSSAARAWCCATSPTRGARSTARSPTTSTRRSLEDVVEWLGELIRATDATLLDEWTLLAGRPVHDHLAPERRPAPLARGRPPRGARPCARPRSAGSSCWPPARLRRRWPIAAAGARSDWPRRWRRTGPSTTASAPTPTPARRGQFDAGRGARPLGRHAAPRRSRRRRRVALRRRRRPRTGQGRGRPHPATRAARPILTPDTFRLTRSRRRVLGLFGVGATRRVRRRVLVEHRPGCGRGTLASKLKTHTAPSILVIDDVGPLPMERGAASALYQVITQRYEKQHSTIVTTNRSLPDWGEIFGDTVVASAISDRLMPNSIVFNIEGPSWRLREHNALTAATTDPSRPR